MIRSVTKNRDKRHYRPVRVPESPGRHPKRSRMVMAPRWGTRETRAISAILAAALTADVATLLAIAWWPR